MNNKTCDIHAHLVPAVDDGAKDFTMAIQMLQTAYEQGINSIVCTSHSYGNTDLYFRNLEKLQKEVKNAGININLYSGCEIYCNSKIIKIIIAELNNKEIPTINNTEYVLIEFNPYEDANEILSCVKELHNNGYKTILAHTERYLNLFGNDKWIAALEEIGCLFQVNAYSIQDTVDMYNRVFARKLLKEQRVAFIGSDAHRTNHRPYMIKNGINYMNEHYDAEYVKNICYRNAKNILNIK